MLSNFNAAPLIGAASRLYDDALIFHYTDDANREGLRTKFLVESAKRCRAAIDAFLAEAEKPEPAKESVPC